MNFMHLIFIFQLAERIHLNDAKAMNLWIQSTSSLFHGYKPMIYLIQAKLSKNGKSFSVKLSVLTFSAHQWVTSEK